MIPNNLLKYLTEDKQHLEIPIGEDLIEIKPNQYIVVDKTAEIKPSKWVYNHISKEYYKFLEIPVKYEHIIILSSLNLDGVDKMEEVDEVEELARIHPDILNHTKPSFIGGFKAGYNTHKESTDKKYSEEQMLAWAGFYYRKETKRPHLIQKDLWKEWKALNQKKLLFEVEEVFDVIGNGKTPYDRQVQSKYQFKKTNGVVKYKII